VVGCAECDPPGLVADNVLIEPFHGQPDRAFFVFSDIHVNGRFEAVWGVRHEWNEVIPLKNVPGASMGAIEALAMSADDTLLAVVSVGEGHPIVDVFRVQELLSRRDSEDIQRVDGIGLIDPYPGGVTLLGWDGGELLLETYMPLDQMDMQRRRVPSHIHPGDEAHVFAWNVEADTITRR
jgi:hypothetical protein